MIWKQLSKLGVPPKFLSILQQLHDEMQARVLTGILQAGVIPGQCWSEARLCLGTSPLHSLPSPTSSIVPYDAVMAFLSNTVLMGVFFNIWQLRAHTKMETVQICELQYADDCGIFAHSSEFMQHSLNMTCTLYQSFGLQVNIQKTEVMS